MKKALFAGSFAPFTNGHTDILRQAIDIFDEVIVAIGCNPDKIEFIPNDINLKLIEASVREFNNVKVTSYNGLTINYAREIGAQTLIRGIRNSKDFEYEKELSLINKDLAPEIKSVFFITTPEFCHISSSVVREMISQNIDISAFVPEPVSEYFKHSPRH